MGSDSDWESTMFFAVEMLHKFGVRYEYRVVSAHRTPERTRDYATEAHHRGLRVIIAGAGGAAHLPGMIAANTHLPVIGVPVKSSVLNGVDSLLSIIQMPPGIPVPTMAIGKTGATNAALCAVSILALADIELSTRLVEFRKQQTGKVPLTPDQSEVPTL
ncbi:MAG: 5-(carboxyamino)imidazole ribonucleotide mutase [Candidatus Parcubacteria bacterium]